MSAEKLDTVQNGLSLREFLTESDEGLAFGIALVRLGLVRSGHGTTPSETKPPRRPHKSVELNADIPHSLAVHVRHESIRLPYRERLLAKALHTARTSRPEGVSAQEAKRLARAHFLERERKELQTPPMIMDGPSEHKKRGW